MLLWKILNAVQIPIEPKRSILHELTYMWRVESIGEIAAVDCQRWRVESIGEIAAVDCQWCTESWFLVTERWAETRVRLFNSL